MIGSHKVSCENLEEGAGTKQYQDLLGSKQVPLRQTWLSVFGKRTDRMGHEKSSIKICCEQESRVSCGCGTVGIHIMGCEKTKT